MRDPGRACRVSAWRQDKDPYKRGAKRGTRRGKQSDDRVVPEVSRKRHDPGGSGQWGELGKSVGRGVGVDQEASE
jgi:hypothetical protein